MPASPRCRTRSAYDNTGAQQHGDRALEIRAARGQALRFRPVDLLEPERNFDQNATIAGTNNPITGPLGGVRNYEIDTKGFDAHNTTRFDFGDVPQRHHLWRRSFPR